MAVRVELWEGAFLRWSCTFSTDRLTWAELCSMAARVELTGEWAELCSTRPLELS